jgi:hypothetical protein
MKKTNFKLFVYIIFGCVFCFAVSCKKNMDPTIDPVPVPVVTTPVDDVTKVTASVSGIVTDENNIPVVNAAVISGTASTTTNASGIFTFRNIQLSKENGNVTVQKNNYLTAVKSFKTAAGKQHQVKIQMMKKVLSGTVNSVAGGTINSNGGATIVFPANAFVTAAGSAYSGSVNIYSRWIDPTAANLPFITPGDLRGVKTDGTESVLETYGMIIAELEDPSGNALKIAPGKTATITGIIPPALLAAAPANIVLWHFDDATARWKENGMAVKAGSTYTAQVDKFSPWNFDFPIRFCNINFTLINTVTSYPLASANVKIKRVSTGNYVFGLTNTLGYVSLTVPLNEPLILEVTDDAGTVVYTQSIGPFTADFPLGTIAFNSATQMVTFTGVIKDCGGIPLPNGLLSFSASNGYAANIVADAGGNISFTVIKNASSAFNYSYVAYDNTGTLQSSFFSGSAGSATAVNIGTVNVCGASSSEFVNLIIDGVAYNFTSASDMFVTTQMPNGLSGWPYTFLTTVNESIYGGVPDAQTCRFAARNNQNTTDGGWLAQFTFFKYSSTGTPLISITGLIPPTLPMLNFTAFGLIPGTYISGSISCMATNNLGGPNKSVSMVYKVKRS